MGDNIRLCLVRTSRDVKPASWAQTLERDAGGDVDRKTICLDERPRLVENSEAVIQKNVRFVANLPVPVREVLYQSFVIELDRSEPGVDGGILQSIPVGAFIWGADANDSQGRRRRPCKHDQGDNQSAHITTPSQRMVSRGDLLNTPANRRPETQSAITALNS
ncbi:MAG TPA: hypothetical protein VKG91_15865 [Roseiarcus sp.]|nr:hypothetical protein [Roseiarcus sp.]